MQKDYPVYLEKNDLKGFFDAHKTSFGTNIKDYLPKGQNSPDFRGPDADKLKAKLSELAASIPKETQDEIDFLCKEMIKDHDDISQDAQAVSDNLQAQGADQQTAAQKLESERVRVLKLSTDIINKTFNGVLSTIKELPEYQANAAVDTWVLISEGFMTFWDKVMGDIGSVIKAVIEWLSSVWETVTGCWASVKAVFVNAWNWFQNVISGF